uniref:NADH-ubiquinone oxidoreductase chain 4 n=1 Tax=Bostrichoidea sp. KM-2015 TaxID=1903809 RepID=A0A343A6Q4_9COLE|nr:NADH dehydrogenase subunit 4 [Bostrichoidea sp. KM-2015]
MMEMVFSVIFMIPLFLSGQYWLSVLALLLLGGLSLKFVSFDYLIKYISYGFGLDLLSFVMILLSVWICSLMLIASGKIYQSSNYIQFFQFSVLCLLISLFVSFCSLNFFLFYIFFEISLVPTLVLILGWGYQPERLRAGVYLFFYTMFASLPMLVVLFYYYKYYYSLMYMYFDQSMGSGFLLFFSMVFFVKMPLFTVHLWLPKAHVEAPVSGSMILAGVMLKLGGYGLMRVLSLFISTGVKISPFFVSISLVGSVIVSLVCLRQSDMKSLIAYSSVAHMGMIVCGLFTFTYWGFSGSLAMMLAHGLCSSGLFCLANINYERLMSRSLLVNKGMINVFPSLSLWWFLLCSSSMAAPPSFNLVSEIMLLTSVVSWSSISMILIFLMSFFSAVYTLFLYSYTQHGSYYSGLYSFYTGYVREFILLVLHWLPLNVMFLKSSSFCLWV